MNILVICVNAINGGAETTIRNFCEKYKRDFSNTYYICTSILNIGDSENIINLRYPNVKKSYFRRAVFDLIETRKIIKKYKIKKIISLQSIGVFNSTLEQVVYIQQALPFAEKRYSIFVNPKYWAYQNIYFRIMKVSLKYADEVIVQTNWMKNAVSDKCNYKKDKIVVDTPIIENKEDKYFNIKNWDKTFFYPTSKEEYKRYNDIFYAVKELLSKKNVKFKVFLTLEKKDLNKELLAIYNKYPKHFELLGYIKRKELNNHYLSDVLLFPSNIESLGLPLLEAKSFRTLIVASDSDNNKELLDSYSNKIYFERNNYLELSKTILNLLEKHEKK